MSIIFLPFYLGLSFRKSIFYKHPSRFIYNSESSDRGLGGHRPDRGPRGLQSLHQTVTKTKCSVNKMMMMGLLPGQTGKTRLTENQQPCDRLVGAATVWKSRASNLIDCQVHA